MKQLTQEQELLLRRRQLAHVNETIHRVRCGALTQYHKELLSFLYYKRVRLQAKIDILETQLPLFGECVCQSEK